MRLFLSKGGFWLSVLPWAPPWSSLLNHTVPAQWSAEKITTQSSGPPPTPGRPAETVHTTWQSPCLSGSLPGPQSLGLDPHSHPHRTDGKMRPEGSHSPLPLRPSPESNLFPSQGCDPRLVGWGLQTLPGREVGCGGLQDPLGVCLLSCPGGRARPCPREMREGEWRAVGKGVTLAGRGRGDLGLGRRRERRWGGDEEEGARGTSCPESLASGPGAWERGPSLGPRLPAPRGGPGTPLRRPSWERVGPPPRPEGLHGCGAITQAQVWAQSGRGGGPAGKARVAALARAARVGPGLVLHRGPPPAARPSESGAGRAQLAPLGLPSPPRPRAGGGPGRRRRRRRRLTRSRVPSNPQPGAGRWVGGGPRPPDLRLGGAGCRLER